MGLDIYAGTLTRYYSHNWKTVVQQWAEENGYSFNRITPDGNPPTTRNCPRPMFRRRWRTGGIRFWPPFLSRTSPLRPWPENNEKPYYTDKPDWDAFGAMLLVAACRTYEEPVLPPWRRTGSSGSIP